ncbi:MAG: hypothetical protein SVY15_00950 [Halobacteriota archaeon]|nr:hypothetical protein [Halobacteriota archaeon]
MSEMQQIENNEVPKRDPSTMCNNMFYETSLYKSKKGVCEGRLLVKEPILMSSKNTRILEFLPAKQIRRPTGYNWKMKTSDADVPFCLYLCENGHISNRPFDSADVPIVPPGTIKAASTGLVSKPQSWWIEMSSEERQAIMGMAGVKGFTPIEEIPEDVKVHLNLENYEKYK